MEDREPVLVVETEHLREAVVKISKHAFVAIDTEFIKLKLCVVQLAVTDSAPLLVDMCVENLNKGALHDLVCSNAIVKVFHGAHLDIKLLHLECGNFPASIFDTQVAAKVVGIGNCISYVKLVKELLGVQLQKEERRSDWEARPLSAAQIGYAAADVTHLRDVYLKLTSMLDEKSKWTEFNTAMTRLRDPETYNTKKARRNQDNRYG